MMTRIVNLNDVVPHAPAVMLAGLSEHTDEVEAAFGFIATATPERIVAHCEASIARGAAAVLSEQDLDAQSLGVPCVTIPDLNETKGVLAAKFYDDPTAKLQCVGVTGTNGKTSVAYHIANLCDELGMPAGYCGTLGWGRLAQLEPTSMTTGNAVALQRQARVLLDDDVACMALEVSSHALAQNRAREVQFDFAVFTNLTRDHLDYHADFASYGAAKQKLFTEWPLKGAVINIDDDFGRALAASSRGRVVTCGDQGDWSWQTRSSSSGLHVSWQTPAGRFEADLSAAAEFAVANITQAMAVLVLMGQPIHAVVDAVTNLRSVPGRLEVVPADRERPLVIVDYAHTPDALAKVLKALRARCSGQLICIVGCGGDRDTGKRAEMGRIAELGADKVWLTSDNPRSEDPELIIAAMQQGMRDANHLVEVDRARAIRLAIAGADAADVVLIAGKGHEDYQEISGKRLPFDDRLHAAAALDSAPVAGPESEG
jgi:UDP-N-acetylmuramoyl-L-alanyl-D-glutamate--2,6-diaminopimelate ligase